MWWWHCKRYAAVHWVRPGLSNPLGLGCWKCAIQQSCQGLALEQRMLDYDSTAMQLRVATNPVGCWAQCTVLFAVLQATRMNALLEEMSRSMEELQLGLDGALNMSDKMEALAKGIATNTVSWKC